MFENLNYSHSRIALLAKLNNATNYLEIGVQSGFTFFSGDLPLKVAVDPYLKFNPLDRKKDGEYFFQMPSDDFFGDLADNSPVVQELSTKNQLAFDIIFIDGLYTYKKSYKDFINSLTYSHEKTLFIIDDAIPCDIYNAINNQEKSLSERRRACMYGTPWHGDVYKTIFTIHDYHPDISYCTILNAGNPQTILWKTKKERSQKKFKSIDDINNMSFYDMISNARLLMPTSIEELPKHIFNYLDPDQDANIAIFEKSIWINSLPYINNTIYNINKSCEVRIQAIMNSCSWKITKPLRFLRHALTKISSKTL